MKNEKAGMLEVGEKDKSADNRQIMSQLSRNIKD